MLVIQSMFASVVRRVVVLAIAGLTSGVTAIAQTSSSNTTQDEPTNILVNGGFEHGLGGWDQFWVRVPGAGTAELYSEAKHGGDRSVRIVHRGEKDWSLASAERLPVAHGEIIEFSAWVRMHGKGNVWLGVVSRDSDGNVLDWNHGGVHVREAQDWQFVRTRFTIPSGVASIHPRIIGDGDVTIIADDFALMKKGNIADLRNEGLPVAVAVSNNVLEVEFHTVDGTFDVRNKLSNCMWRQSLSGSPIVVLDVTEVGAGLDLRLIDPVDLRDINAKIRLDPERAEVVVSLKADGDMWRPLRLPAPFETEDGQDLIIPMNEGISYPVGDNSIPENSHYLYGGHGLCMAWYGVVANGGAGWMAIVETPDDASMRIARRGGLLRIEPEWHPQKGRFGQERVIRYVFLDSGGYVAMAKRYRQYAKDTGLFKTLEEKRKAVPSVDLLIGAANVWCWDNDAPELCREMKELGIERILWSSSRSPEELKKLNGMGVLTSRYDIYQDSMNPTNFPQLRWIHDDWTSDAWENDDLMIRADGEWVRGWEVEAKDGTRIPCGTLCDMQALPYARRRIPAELATHPYHCRFIDTTTASPWRECYHPKHPMTRTESKRSKMELLRYVSEERGLVCGSETGHDAAVPYVHYFEGMLSLGSYRVPDSGRDMARIWDEVPPDVAKFQTGHNYRLPLWELVYHDCVVAQWYWGDYNNKLPALWDRRDLWNALYGTPPMFMFDRKQWNEKKERFAKSYKTTAPVARATAYSEMVSHEWLTEDRAVQRTRFANGVTVTVNFGETPYELPEGVIPPLGCNVEGLEKALQNIGGDRLGSRW